MAVPGAAGAFAEPLSSAGSWRVGWRCARCTSRAQPAGLFKDETGLGVLHHRIHRQVVQDEIAQRVAGRRAYVQHVVVGARHMEHRDDAGQAYRAGTEGVNRPPVCVRPDGSR